MVIAAGETDKCPHCGTSNRFEGVQTDRGGIHDLDVFGVGRVESNEIKLCRCTACHEIVIFLDERMIWPLGFSRPKCPKEVPGELAEDYNEACLVEPLSHKAAAALARRCLQNILYNQGIKGKDLNEEIDLAMPGLPAYLSKAIDAIRHIGNFSAHPLKYQNTGQIVDVEPGEVEWVLDTVYSLFDYYYVQPKVLDEKRKKLDLKLKQMGKPSLK